MIYIKFPNFKMIQHQSIPAMFETFFTEARLIPISETLVELHRLFLKASVVLLLSEFGYVCLFVDA